MGRCHAQEHAGMDADQFHRSFAIRSRHGVFRRHAVQIRRSIARSCTRPPITARLGSQINNGIPQNAFTRCIREDPNKRRSALCRNGNRHLCLLRRRSEMAVAPIESARHAHRRPRDSKARARAGRRHTRHGLSGFWTILSCWLNSQMASRNEDVHLFAPKHAYRGAFGRGFGGGLSGPAHVGTNPPNGAVIYYWLKDKPQGEVTLEFMDAQGKLVKKFSSTARRASASGFGCFLSRTNPAGGASNGRPPRRWCPARSGKPGPEPLCVGPSLSRCNQLSRHDSLGRQRTRTGGCSRHLPGEAHRRRKVADSEIRGSQRPARSNHAPRIFSPARAAICRCATS